MDASDALPLDATGRVLLVEDDEGLGELIAEYLGRNGLEIHWVRRGDTAIEKAHEIAPDRLLLDVMLPARTASTSAASCVRAARRCRS